MKIGLALGGGGVRGAAHIGVLYELESIGIRPTILAGTSSGGLVAALYASGAPLEEIEILARGLTWRSVVGRKIPFRTPKPTLLDAVEHYIGNKSFESLPIPLRVSAFDPITNEVIVLGKGPILPALRATIALPGFLPPARTDEHPILVDGGLVCSLPTGALDGVNAIIAVDVGPGDTGLRRPRPFRRKQWIYEQAYIALHRRSTAADQARADIVLSPNINDVNTFEFSKIDRCIESGRIAVTEQRDEITALTR